MTHTTDETHVQYQLAALHIDRNRRSPNYNERPHGRQPDAIILHSCEGRYSQGTLSWLCSTRSQVSYHYYVNRQGLIYELVAPEQRAWHVSAHGWNDRAIGVSLHHKQHNAIGEYTQAQRESAVKLCRALIARYDIEQHNVKAHRWVQSWNKIDPTDWPDQELANWISALYIPDDTSMTVPLPGTYETVRGSVVRSAPAVERDNLVMRPHAGAWLQIREWAHGQMVAGSSWWGHLASEQGFIHWSGVSKRIGD
jgi:hypothetical protein